MNESAFPTTFDDALTAFVECWAAGELLAAIGWARQVEQRISWGDDTFPTTDFLGGR